MAHRPRCEHHSAWSSVLCPAKGSRLIMAGWGGGVVGLWLVGCCARVLRAGRSLGNGLDRYAARKAVVESLTCISCRTTRPSIGGS